MNKEFDTLQMQAIEAHDGKYLVLAPPGCGKTEILAERIARALDRGVKPEEMLCLTFTNRASRGMLNRVCERLEAKRNELDIFIGNLHRYCSIYLINNEAIPENAYILDDDDQTEIISDLNSTLVHYRTGNINRNAINYISGLATYIDQRRMGHPESVLPSGPGVLDTKSGEFLTRDFSYFYDIAGRYNFDPQLIPSQHQALTCALQYSAYKKSHTALDFADLLVLAYDHMVTHSDHIRYSWIQIDEVQDLNRLQLAIADELTAPGATAMYLGDEQQAIFSFMGAKLSNLDILRKRCHGHVLTLSSNYRAPSYLLDVCNTYAEQVLGVSPEILPRAVRDEPHRPLDLILTESDDPEKEAMRIEGMVDYYLKLDTAGKERMAILVSCNAQADTISEALTAAGKSNFKISGTDMFRSKAYKTLTALYSVIVNDFDMGAWTRLLYGLGCLRTQIATRDKVHAMRSLMLTPSDLLRHKPYIRQVYEIYTGGEAVVFDTETTGLNVLEDDIVQIAAFKIRDGKKVAGSDFNIILHTDRELPEMLGDLPNPLIAEYAARPHMARAEGLRRFLDYTGSLPLIGHNITYDYLMLRNNCARELQEDVTFTTFDTLSLAKLVAPELKKYTLASLVDTFGLQGENAHLADADIEATLSLLDHCMAQAAGVLRAQEQFIANPSTQLIAGRLGKIAPLRSNITSYLHLPVSVTGRTIADDLAFTCRTLTEQGLIDEIGPKFDIFLRYVQSEWVQRDSPGTLFDQVSAHIRDLTASINEGDLVNSDELITDRLFIMTVHKAKGLQFDNVVVLGVNDGTYPYFTADNVLRSPYSTTEMKQRARAQIKEDARKLYVAISRAGKRLCLSYTRVRQYGYLAGMSPFLHSVSHLFHTGRRS